MQRPQLLPYMKSCTGEVLFACNASEALPFQLRNFLSNVHERESTAMPENQTVQSAAFGAPLRKHSR